MLDKVLIGGLAATLMAGAAMAQAQPAPPAPPAVGQPGHDRHERGPGRGEHFRGPPRASLEQVQKRNAEVFARIDANRDGRATQAEYAAFIERRRQERLDAMFKRFSGGQDSVTLEQLNTRTAERYKERGRGRDDRPQPGERRGG